ncbi:MAG: hypothetical protein AB8F26_06285 [Phycisphaerales bacterium]
MVPDAGGSKPPRVFALGLQRLGDIAVWPGLYAVGVAGLLLWCVGASRSDFGWRDLLPLAVFVFLCSQGGYLLDRAKISGKRLDPADETANSARFHVFAVHGGLIRRVVAIEFAAAALVGIFIEPWLAIVPIGTSVGVMIYAGRPAEVGKPRPKDLLVLKAGFIATAHLALACAAVMVLAGFEAILSINVVTAVTGVWLIVLGDAVVCDFDDIEADRAFGTLTLPVVFGENAAWALALVCHLGAAVLILEVRGIAPAVGIACLLVASMVMAMMLPRRKDYIDARLLCVALICLANS